MQRSPAIHEDSGSQFELSLTRMPAAALSNPGARKKRSPLPTGRRLTFVYSLSTEKDKPLLQNFETSHIGHVALIAGRPHPR